MFYLTGETASRGGLRMGDLKLWPTIQDAVSAMKDEEGNMRRHSARIYRITPGGGLVTKIDLSKIGFGNYYMSKKAIDKRVGVRIKKDVADETLELHQRYGKHEYKHAIDGSNFLMHCPSCGAFGFEVVLDYSKPKSVLPLLPSDFTSPVVFYLPELMEYLQDDMRRKLGSYLKSVGYGRVSPDKLVALDAMMEGTYAELDNKPA